MIKDNIDVIVLFVASLFMAVLLTDCAKASSGKILYRTKCASCHNINPAYPGSIGPDIAGSSLELIRLKTQERKYPVGYTPKRKTRVMPKIKLNENQIKLLHEYINSFGKKK
jgi:mono/diheme cytochrome c family protein